MGALSHLRIVEIGSAAATSYCARLFADFGATVQKIEPPQGDPLRRTAPLTPKGHSAWFAFLNFNKSSVALDRNDAGASCAPDRIDRGVRHSARRPRHRCGGLSGIRSRCAQAAQPRPHPSRSKLVRPRGALREIRSDGLDDPCADRTDKTGRAGRGAADACAGFPDRHLRRPLGIYRGGILGARPDAGRPRTRELASASSNPASR